ncbi:MAG: hypothetical protein MJZ00_06005 [Paludibacteraceae bacterium]|nr:hypothetical protein [Paludibacteraceae bacterium]
MGAGRWDNEDFTRYATASGKSYDAKTKRVNGQTYRSTHLDKDMDPKGVIRECVNTAEHPNTIPIILALDVTGSMGSACIETAQSLAVIMEDLYKKYADIEFMVMGIGDLDYDNAPIQASQFESDVRIAKWLDKIYMEHGGGGNKFESYTAAWYFGLYHTKLDAFDKQGRKGIIITMGDEGLNPYLPKERLNNVTGDKNQADIETKDLYKAAIEKFDIFHIAVDATDSSYNYHKENIENSFGKLLGDRYKVATINGLSNAITECINDSQKNNEITFDTTGDDTGRFDILKMFGIDNKNNDVKANNLNEITW